MGVPIYVFVSYAEDDLLHSDKAAPMPLCDEVGHMLKTDLLVCPRLLKKGARPEDLAEQAAEYIHNSHYLLLLLTEQSATRPWVYFECGLAYSNLGKNYNLAPSGCLHRILMLTPDLGFQPPNFPLPATKRRYQWHRNKVIHMNRETADDRCRVIWPRGVRNHHVMEELGQVFLGDVFTNKLALLQSGQKFTSREQYEDWLNAFAAWSRTDFFAVSRQPLDYWWKGRGTKYRERLAAFSEGDDEVSLRRLTVWDSIADALPCSYRKLKIDDSKIATAVGRGLGHKYCCNLARDFDMLCGFAFSCHKPLDNACYIFSECIDPERIPDAWKHWNELLTYNDTFTLKVKGDLDEPEYHLFDSSDSDSIEFQDMFIQAHDGRLTTSAISFTPGGGCVNGSGTLKDFIIAIRDYHNCAVNHTRIALPERMAQSFEQIQKRQRAI